MSKFVLIISSIYHLLRNKVDVKGYFCYYLQSLLWKYTKKRKSGYIYIYICIETREKKKEYKQEKMNTVNTVFRII